jgi:hypothetical protein
MPRSPRRAATVSTLSRGGDADDLQGCFFARPMPADPLRTWTADRQPAGAPDFSPSVRSLDLST